MKSQPTIRRAVNGCLRTMALTRRGFAEEEPAAGADFLIGMRRHGQASEGRPRRARLIHQHGSTYIW